MFKYVDRGKKNTLVLVPGWASDWRIFGGLNLGYNYLLPTALSPVTFEQDLLEYLTENSLRQVSLLGWSLGGFLCAEFAGKHQKVVSKLMLVSIREKYVPEELARIRRKLSKNRTACLRWFYHQCRADTERDNGLLEEYCRQLNAEILFSGLDYLAQACIDTAKLRDIRAIKIIHGECDQIAPPAEAVRVKDALPDAEFVLMPGAGHIPFGQEGFEKAVNAG